MSTDDVCQRARDWLDRPGRGRYIQDQDIALVRDLHAEVKRIKVDLDTRAAAIDRVQKLLDQWEARSESDEVFYRWGAANYATELRAALNGEDDQ